MLVTPRRARRAPRLRPGRRRSSRRGRPSAGVVAGTPAYMAPEQAAAAPLGPAADWYARRRDALRGAHRPAPVRRATLIEILRARSSTDDPPPPRALVGRRARRSRRLCVGPAPRATRARAPRGAEVLARPRDGAADAPARPPERAAIGDAVRRARGRARDALADAFDAVRARRRTVVGARRTAARGSARARSSAASSTSCARPTPTSCVLAGRCYERESVPYKALDSLIDALSRYLGGCRRPRSEALLPRDVAHAGAALPGARRVEAVAPAPRRGGRSADPQRAAAARVRARCASSSRASASGGRWCSPSTISSGATPTAARCSPSSCAPPDAAARCSFVAAYRTDEAERSACLRALAPGARGAARAGARASREIARRARSAEREARALALARCSRERAARRLERAARDRARVGRVPVLHPRALPLLADRARRRRGAAQPSLAGDARRRASARSPTARAACSR